MTSEKLPVVAAIPNYNMSKGLARLLPQVLEQRYDHIYVLDDCSTDDSESVVISFGKKVTFLKNKVNQGAGGARNLIIPHLKEVSLIHFMDADISLVSKNNPEIIRRLGIDESTGFVGGLVFESDGKQSIWNYGQRLSITESSRSIIQSMNKSWSRLFTSKPHPADKPRKRDTFWVLERSFVIRSDTLEKLGGLDPLIREHDIQPLALKAHKAGLVSRFDPSFSVKSHQDIDVRPYNRLGSMVKAELYIIKKYGSWLHWFFPFLNKKRPQ